MLFRKRTSVGYQRQNARAQWLRQIAQPITIPRKRRPIAGTHPFFAPIEGGIFYILGKQAVMSIIQFAPRILPTNAIMALRRINAQTEMRSNCNDLSRDRRRCFGGEKRQKWP